MLKATVNWLTANWERVLFVAVGLVFLVASLSHLYAEKATEAAVAFGLGFLCFIYANVSRFKRFKGLGFEAELWEDKQKEAAGLIERLRDIVSIYTKEVLLTRVTSNRFADGSRWPGHWKLYNDLMGQHAALGQSIDFTSVKKTMDDYFLFDITLPLLDKLRASIIEGKGQASKKIAAEFGTPIRDADAYGKRTMQLHAIDGTLKDPFQLSSTGNLAERALDLWRNARSGLKRDFDVDISLDSAVQERLEAIGKLYQNRPVLITDQLLGWASRED